MSKIVKEAKTKVTLIAHTPDPEKIITAAAKLCYSSSDISDLLENCTEESIAKFLNMIMKLGHGSILEHVVFTFGIEGVSRVTEIQLLRKRTASPSVQSGRYVKRDCAEYVVPPRIAASPVAFDLYMEELERVQKTYIDIIDALKIDFPDLDEKLIIEDARYIQSQALGTKLIFTIDLRNTLDLIKLRKCRRAQWEARGVILLIEEALKEILPTIGKYMGAPCEFGPCKEGKLSCKEPYKRK